jgi:hypothetical protein
VEFILSKCDRTVEEQKKQKRQHFGLRCPKCFALLARDEDFEYRNGRLLIKPHVIREREWKGLVIEKSKVYCMNMHQVGNMVSRNSIEGLTLFQQPTTHANKTTFLASLWIEKTTFVENFLKNPKYANSDLIKNKWRANELHTPGTSYYHCTKTISNNSLEESDEWRKVREVEGWEPSGVADRYHNK